MKTFNKLMIAMLMIAAFASGQTILGTTTLGAAITVANTQNLTVTLASTSTMLSQGGPGNQINTVLYVDRELMWVLSVVDSTHVTAVRAKGIGAGGRPTTHANGAPVTFSITTAGIAAPGFFSQVQTISENNGSCTASTLLVLPLIHVYSGNVYDCVGGHWVQTNAPGAPLFGAVVASPAGVLTPTGTLFHVSGTNAITGITVFHGLAAGMSITIIPDGVFTWTTATNISIAGTAVVNKALTFFWDGTKWSPSYLS